MDIVPQPEYLDDAMLDHENRERFCFVFVCQQGALEAKAVLLAASLRRYLSVEHDLVAALPTPRQQYGTPSKAALTSFEQLSVRTTPIINRISPDYPIGNKIDCLAIETDCPHLIFVDSDVMLLRPIDLSPLSGTRLAAVPASRTQIGKDHWEQFYLEFNLPIPPTSMHTLISKELTLPYFNSGFLVVESKIAASLANAWADCALKLRRRSDLPERIRNRFLDQVSLPIAAARLGIDILPLGPEWNFPSWSMKIGDTALPAFFHYQKLPKLLEETVTKDILFSLVKSKPSIADAIFHAFNAVTDDKGAR